MKQPRMVGKYWKAELKDWIRANIPQAGDPIFKESRGGSDGGDGEGGNGEGGEGQHGEEGDGRDEGMVRGNTVKMIMEELRERENRANTVKQAMEGTREGRMVRENRANTVKDHLSSRWIRTQQRYYEKTISPP